MTATLVNGYVPGCIGRTAELHARYYHPLVGFGLPFEAKVARELANFCERFTADRDGLWFVVVDGRVEGSIAIDAEQVATDGAHLRWFITSDTIRGKGMGQRLLAEALAFVDGRGYERTCLWTFEGLTSARHLYEKHGFELVTSGIGAQWGRPVEEQMFARGRG